MTVHKNTVVDVEMIAKGDVDEVILAVGSSPIQIQLEGADKLTHVSAPEAVSYTHLDVYKRQTRY